MKSVLAFVLCSAGMLVACPSTVGTPEGQVTRPQGPPTCRGVACSAGQDCCLLTGRCFDVTRRDAECAAPPSSGSRRACGSNSDCQSTEVCHADACLGAGECTPLVGFRAGYPICEGPGVLHEPACGCDGVTYQNGCRLHIAGVRRAAWGACGAVQPPIGDSGLVPPTGCLTDAMCQAGQSCCARLGQCLPADCPECCAPPADGGRVGCRDNSMCSGAEYCDGAGCGTPGACFPRRPREDCEGIVDPVCGCDGRTYTNDCWASAAGARLRSRGACDGG